MFTDEDRQELRKIIRNELHRAVNFATISGVDSASMQGQANRLRDARVRRIAAAELPGIDLVDGAKVILHVIPAISLSLSSVIDLRRDLDRCKKLLSPGHGTSFFINLDGSVAYSHASGGERKVEAYLQVFRNGTIEALLVFPRIDSYAHNNEPPAIYSSHFEPVILAKLNEVLDLYRDLKIEPPFFVCLSLANIEGFQLKTPTKFWQTRTVADRDLAFLSGVQIDDPTEPSDVAIRPIFDSLWNLFGQSHCLAYNDENGRYVVE